MSKALATLAVVALCVIALALCTGPTGFDLELIDLRWTRVALGALAGSALAVTGCSLQALMRNPLADPFVLGVSGGAAAFGSAAIIFLPFSNFFVTPLAAFVGAMLVSVSLLYFLKREDEQGRDRALLLGIAINAFASSFITVIKTLAPMRDTQTLLFWLIGGIGYVDKVWLLAALAFSLMCLAILWSRARTLEILKLGDDEAFRLGVNIAQEKRLIYVAASCLVGICVSMCGMIAFVGLTTPHILRPFVGTRERELLPACALLGVILVTGVDTLSRLSYGIFGTELPVGALLALLGAPFFVWILCKRGSHAHA
jgi:iron complex transport system permease protein